MALIVIYITLNALVFTPIINVHILDVDECSPSNTCQNSGVCTNSVGSYSCDCSGTGFEGTDCETGNLI